MVVAFSLKLQRDNRKNALAVDPSKGKTGKRLYFSPHCGDETTAYYDTAFEKSPSPVPPPAKTSTSGEAAQRAFRMVYGGAGESAHAAPFPFSHAYAAGKQGGCPVPQGSPLRGQTGQAKAVPMALKWCPSGANGANAALKLLQEEGCTPHVDSGQKAFRPSFGGRSSPTVYKRLRHA